MLVFLLRTPYQPGFKGTLIKSKIKKLAANRLSETQPLKQATKRGTDDSRHSLTCWEKTPGAAGKTIVPRNSSEKSDLK